MIPIIASLFVSVVIAAAVFNMWWAVQVADIVQAKTGSSLIAYGALLITFVMLGGIEIAIVSSVLGHSS